MAHRQVIEAGTFRLQEGGMLPNSTYASEMLRLEAEAIHAGAGARLDARWIKRRIKQDIRHGYGRVCFLCDQTITLRWNGAPLTRYLMAEDVPPPPGDTYGFFHAECARTYDRRKRNARRQALYAAQQGVVNPQAVQVVIPQAAPVARPPLVNPPPAQGTGAAADPSSSPASDPGAL